MHFYCLAAPKKSTTNNYYSTPGEGGAIVGIVSPAGSNAKVSAYMGIEIASTQIDEKGYYKLTGLPAGTFSLVVQAEGYNEYSSKPYIEVADGATAVADTIFLTSIRDLISSVYPSDGTEGVGLDQPIRIAFRRKMDKESAEKAFKIEPPVEGEFSWYERPEHGPFELRLRPDDYFAANTLYEVKIDTTAADTGGITQYEPYEFSFTTERIGIDYTYPSDNATWVVPNSEINIYFNTDMDMESVNSAFKMVDSEQREVTGTFAWSNRQRVIFYPNSALAVDEEYTVTIDTTASDAGGTRLSEPYQFSFTTQPLMITSVKPTHKSTWIPVTADVGVIFNTDMDMESVSSAFEMVDSEKNEVAGEFVWYTLSHLEFDPDSTLAYDETYTVTIDTNAKDTYGTNLTQAYTFWFKTRTE